MDVVGAINARTSIATNVSAADRLKQSSELNNQIQQNDVNRSAGQTIRKETSVDTSAPVKGTPLSGFADKDLLAPSPRGNNLDISV